MWIRTQDEKQLLNCNRIFVEGTSIKGEIVELTNNIFTLGSYSTEERALNILNDIQSNLFKEYAYEMPFR